jgi:cellulose synthase/poly-beta-1,6-N-acetylglucosamine synthase-like glycosyltransferase
MISLRSAFVAASPRLTLRATPALSVAIYAAVALAWLLLVGRALSLDNVWAWSAGIAYILYDTVLTLLVVGMTWSFRRAPSAPLATVPRPTLGVIIAAHNEALQLPATLDAIFAQSIAADVVLIADDGSRDGTALVLEGRYGLIGGGVSVAYPLLRLMQLPHRGKAVALNAALGAIATDIVVTIDADTRLAPDALEAIAAAFAADRNLVGAGGVLVPFCAPTPSGRVLQFFQTYEYIRNMISRFAWMRGNCLLLISGAFAAFRTDALRAVGGFDTRSLVEDYELTHRMHRYSAEHALGWRLAMIGGAQARTEAPSEVSAFLRQRRRWFAGFLQTQYWNRDMTGNPRFGAVGLLMLPVKALDTLQPIYGLLSFAILIALIASGRSAAAFSVAGLIGAKIVFDFAAFLWSVHLYRRITGGRIETSYGMALLAALIEPFSFQLLRHSGAAWGWIAFLSGSREWGVAARAEAAEEQPAE